MLTAADQVQIYEAIMVDSQRRRDDRATARVRFVKDNRLLPRGFDKGYRCAGRSPFRESARDDADFVGGRDRVRYRIALGAADAAPLIVEAELLYQSIGYRWAENLRGYSAEETQRFGRYYAENAAASAVPLARRDCDRASR